MTVGSGPKVSKSEGVMGPRSAGSVPPRKVMFSERNSASIPASPRT